MLDPRPVSDSTQAAILTLCAQAPRHAHHAGHVYLGYSVLRYRIYIAKLQSPHWRNSKTRKQGIRKLMPL
jgi:hypothetical protein